MRIYPAQPGLISHLNVSNWKRYNKVLQVLQCIAGAVHRHQGVLLCSLWGITGLTSTQAMFATLWHFSRQFLQYNTGILVLCMLQRVNVILKAASRQFQASLIVTWIAVSARVFQMLLAGNVMFVMMDSGTLTVEMVRDRRDRNYWLSEKVKKRGLIAQLWGTSSLRSVSFWHVLLCNTLLSWPENRLSNKFRLSLWSAFIPICLSILFWCLISPPL